MALPAPVASSIGVGPLQPVTLQVGARSVTALVGATLQEADIGSLVHSPIAVAPVAYAQRLREWTVGSPRILVQTSPGHERDVQAGLEGLAKAGEANVEPADFVTKLFQVAAAPTNQGTELFSAISALVGFLFAFNAILVTTNLRRTLVENLRHWGATRLMAIQVLLLDALVLGILGSALGTGVRRVALHRSLPYDSWISLLCVSDRIAAGRHLAEHCAGSGRRAGVGLLGCPCSAERASPPLDTIGSSSAQRSIPTARRRGRPRLSDCHHGHPVRGRCQRAGRDHRDRVPGSSAAAPDAQSVRRDHRRLRSIAATVVLGIDAPLRCRAAGSIESRSLARHRRDRSYRGLWQRGNWRSEHQSTAGAQSDGWSAERCHRSVGLTTGYIQHARDDSLSAI